MMSVGKSALLVMSAILLVACGGKKENKSYDSIGASGLTTRTENLQTNLFTYQDKGVMIGQAYGTTTAIGEVGDTIQGDIYKMADDKPAAIGFELRGVETDRPADIRGVEFTTIKRSIMAHFRKQGLVVLSWTAPNYNDEDKLGQYLSRLSNFVSSLMDDYGIKAPVVLALYPLGHSQWYDRLSADEYKQLYEKTVDMLRQDTLTNAVFAYSNNATAASADEFMSRCPIDEVDLVQLEMLSDNAKDYGSLLAEKAKSLSDYCNSHMKAFGVYGGVRGLDGNKENFLTDNILPVLQSVKMSYFMFGQNMGSPTDGNYYLPFAGSKNVNDFMNIYNDKHTIFLRGLNGLLLDHSKKQN